MVIKGVNHFLFSVTDLDKSIAFYENVFGGKLLVKGQKTAYLDVSGMWFALNVERDIPRNEIRESYTHIAFSVDEHGLKEMVEKLNAIGALILSGRERDTRDMKSIYFEDFDGHKFEFHSGTLQDRLDYYKEAKVHMDFYTKENNNEINSNKYE
ncbi:MAG TPA: metallothiol transferase FosB [Sporosarcina psychrophila]|uniref:Metallothiol transferase FosB n=1 Tax=Sporosarcina psychrophila TaxID=1476 RepID=A0A921G0I4_SPOPS|nr:metallothiol transferase FosB [Sporosarcina psychrophila]